MSKKVMRRAQGKRRSKTDESDVVRARIDKRIKEEASVVLAVMGLTPSAAYRMMMTRIATEKALPFEMLVPNEETIEAMKAARRGDLVAVDTVGNLLDDLNADD